MARHLRGQIFIFLALGLAGCARVIDSGEMLPTELGPPPQLERATSIAVKASIPLTRLQDLVDEAAPRSVDVDERLTSLKIKLHGSLQRGDIVLTPVGSGIGFASEVTGRGSAPVSWAVRGNLLGTLLPEIRPDYTLVSRLQIRADVEKAKLKLDYLPDVSLRGVLEDLLKKEGRKTEARLDRELNRDDRVRREVERLWRTAHGVSRLGREREAFLVYHPTAVFISNPALRSVAGAPSIEFGLGVSGQLELLFGQAPAAPKPGPLPPATIRPLAPGGIQVALPLVAEPAVLAKIYSRRLEKRKIKVGKKRLRITAVEAAGVDQLLMLKCQVRDERWWRPVEAQLFITGVPYLDAQTRSIRLRNLTVTTRSRNVLVKAAAYLASPAVTQYIAEQAVYPLASLEGRAHRDAERWAADLAEKSRGAVRATISAIHLDAVSMQSGYLIADASATGTIDADVVPLLADLHIR
jgi:hypothetical protein